MEVFHLHLSENRSGQPETSRYFMFQKGKRPVLTGTLPNASTAKEANVTREANLTLFIRTKSNVSMIPLREDACVQHAVGRSKAKNMSTISRGR